MFTNEQIKALFLRVMDRMLEAHWLKCHTFTDDKGHHLTWTSDGALRALRMLEIIKSFGLDEGDKTEMIFDLLANGDTLPGGFRFLGDLPDDILAYWRESVAQLKLRGDEDGLLAMVHIIRDWAPDANTPIKIG